MSVLENIYLVLLFIGGVLALSGLIVAKAPNARGLLSKLVPYQALIGVGLLALGLVLLIRIGPIDMFAGIKRNPVLVLATIGAVYSGILLGFCFGMAQIAAWLPGQSSAEAKGVALSRKLAPYTMFIGVVMLGSAIVLLLAKLGLLKYI